MTKYTKQEIEDALEEASQKIVPDGNYPNARDEKIRQILSEIAAHSEALEFLIALSNAK